MIVQRVGQRIISIGGPVYTMPRSAAAAGNGLLNSLIAYWPGNEASGNALDLHTNALHLTDTNTVTNAAGLVYATARQYTAANSEYHARAGDDALLSTGDVDFTLAAWVYFDALGAERTIASKWSYSTSSREYMLRYAITSARFSFIISANGAAAVSCDATSFGQPIANTWYFVIGWHDSVANTLNIQVDNGAVDSVAHAGGVHDGSARFTIGTIWNPANYMNGRIGPTMFWKSAAGGGGVLTAAQRTALYNAGAGLPYASFTV